MEHAGCYNVLAANHQLLKTCWLLSYKLLTIQLLATFENNTDISKTSYLKALQVHVFDSVGGDDDVGGGGGDVGGPNLPCDLWG